MCADACIKQEVPRETIVRAGTELGMVSGIDENAVLDELASLRRIVVARIIKLQTYTFEALVERSTAVRDREEEQCLRTDGNSRLTLGGGIDCDAQIESWRVGLGEA